MKNIIKKILKEEFSGNKLKPFESRFTLRRGINENSSTDTTIFHDLYNTYWSKMLNGVCRKYTNDINKAEDYCQNGFMKVFQNLHKYQNTGSVEGWVRRIINNSIIDEIRKEKLRHHSNDETDWSRIDTNDEPYSEDYSIEQIEDVLHNLSPKYRQVFELYYFDNLTHEQIANKLGINIGTSKSNLFKAIKRIKELLKTEDEYM
jgi:RNA polymerase sigma-70 factor (ECF subfamily)